MQTRQHLKILLTYMIVCFGIYSISLIRLILYCWKLHFESLWRRMWKRMWTRLLSQPLCKRYDINLDTPLNPLLIQTFFTRQWPALRFNGWSDDYPKQLRTRYGGLRSRMGLRHWKWPSFWFGCVSRSTWQGNPINSFPHYAMKKSTRKGKIY